MSLYVRVLPGLPPDWWPGNETKYISLWANWFLYICNLVQLHSCVVSSHQHVDELSEGLIWASREGCLEDVVFLLSTGVEVNTRGQVRLRRSRSGYYTSYCIAGNFCKAENFPIKHHAACEVCSHETFFLQKFLADESSTTHRSSKSTEKWPVLL